MSQLSVSDANGEFRVPNVIIHNKPSGNTLRWSVKSNCSDDIRMVCDSVNVWETGKTILSYV